MQAPQARQGAILVNPGEPAIADDIRGQDCRHFPDFAQLCSSGRRNATIEASCRGLARKADYSGKPNIRAPRIIFSSRVGM